MKINILFGAEGAKEARGIVVIIDVFRAASTASYILEKGAKYIIPVSTADEAFAEKYENPDFILMGEEKGYKIEGFDFGNSPFEVIEAILKDKVVVFRTTQGTQGIVNAKNASEILFGSFPYAQAIVDYINLKKSETVSLVVMGDSGEDEVFAQFLKKRLEGENPKIEAVVEEIRVSAGAQRFLDPHLLEFPTQDFELCLAADIFNFVPIVAQMDGHQIIIKKDLN